MNTKKLAAIAFSLSIAPCLLLIFLAMSRLISNAITPSPAAAALPDAPVVSAISPNSAPNDIDMPVTITGTGFMAELSGTQIITPPFAFLGDILLKDLIWVDGTNLNATIPWGLNEGAYTLTVMNPDGGMGVLTDAFTVTPGIGVWTTNGPYGGTVDQITLNPDNPSTLYAQGHDVGLFVSDDAAGEWEMAYRLPRYHVDISFDAENKDVFYVGDEHGLSRTTDGAQSWEDISILPGGAWKHVAVTNPTQPGTVYASAGQWLDSEGEGGVFRSDDYGNSWITLTIGLTDTHFTSLAIHPILTQTLLAGTKSGNLFYSQDGGQTWNRTTNITATVVNVYFNPFEAFEAWATTDSGLIGMPSLHRSENLTKWTPIIVDENLSSWGWYGWDMDFVSDTIWATSSGSYFSTDGGDTWEHLESEGSCSQGTWLAINPENPQVMYSAPFIKGICVSEDGGHTWRESNEGLAAIVPAETVVATDDPDTIYLRAPGLDLAKSESGGEVWRLIDIGIGGSPRVGLAVDPFLIDLVYANTMRSDDGGDTWSAMTFTIPITWSGWVFSLVDSIAPHPTIPGLILAGIRISDGESNAGLLYASDDYGEQWSYIGLKQPISFISQIAYDSANPELIYAATWSSGLLRSNDGGQAWEILTPSGIYTELWQVFTHPDITEVVYLFARQPPHGEFKFLISYDAGDTWITLPGGVNAPFYFAPTQPTSLYAPCGDYNLLLCRSWDGGYTWEVVSEVQQEITTLTGGTDGERVIIYIGTKGGEVSTESNLETLSIEPLNILPGRGSLLGAGVYRFTILPPPLVYLPLVSR